MAETVRFGRTVRGEAHSRFQGGCNRPGSATSPQDGARRESCTPTLSPVAGFESAVSAIPPLGQKGADEGNRTPKAHSF
jgi:hypothetical protein